MSYPPRPVPLNYAELLAAMNNGIFPDERDWLDFKRQLYPPLQPGERLTDGQKRKAHEELARDLASMAVWGGFLIFGVAEDKAAHTFTVVDVDLPAGITETIDMVARSRITPPLAVTPTIVAKQPGSSQGLLVVEVPESPDAPHMVDGVYYRRSATGKVRLTDDEVERLILRRGRTDDRLREAMADTKRFAPRPDSVADNSHFFFTAVPTQPSPEMLLAHTQDHEARNRFLQVCTALVNSNPAEINDPRRRNAGIAYDELLDHRRSQQPRGAWFTNWSQERPEFANRAIGVEDDGIVRFVDLYAGNAHSGHHFDGMTAAFAGDQRGLLVYELMLYWRALDVIRLVGHLADLAGYRGAWLIGIELDNLRGRVSAASGGPRGGYDHDDHVHTIRVTVSDLYARPYEIATQLMRPLFRDLGGESILPAPQSPGTIDPPQGHDVIAT